MYAIKAGNEFIKNADYGTVTVSATARTFKNRKDAETELASVLLKTNQYLASYTQYRDNEVTKLAKAQKTIAAKEKLLEKLYDLPFRDVELKVKNARSAIYKAKWYVTSNSIKSYNQSIARLSRILDNQPKVVELKELV